MVVRWRAGPVLLCTLLSLVSVILLLQGLRQGSTTGTPILVRGRESLSTGGASSLGNHSRWSQEEEKGGGANQQLHRRLLGTMATPFYRHAPHTSFIKLEGVDSVGNDLFLVHGASIPQLKDVCKALEECEGFNSEGWIKSRVSGKKRATIDLYLKQVARSRVGGLLPEDEAAGVFLDHMHHYDQMEHQLHIYIYPTDVGKDLPSWEDYKYGVEYLFTSLLAKSKFRTMDPNKATLFFLPSRCTAYRKSVAKLEEGVAKAATVMRDMVTQIKTRFPFWNESLGADHFYICAHDMGTEVAKLADTALWKNAIGLVNTADYSEEYFVSHKDISLPPHPGRGTIDWAAIGQGGATFDPYQRTKLAFMAGHAERGAVRPLIYQYYQQDPDFHLVTGSLSDEDYIKALKTSKFCLCARGLKAWSPRVMDALWFGCIPVFLADHYVPPLCGLIPWDNISLSIPERQVASLKVILESISAEKITAFQQNILAVYPHLTWHDPPRPYDAFHAILFQLWQRRHVHRTSPFPLPEKPS